MNRLESETPTNLKGIRRARQFGMVGNDAPKNPTPTVLRHLITTPTSIIELLFLFLLLFLHLLFNFLFPFSFNLLCKDSSHNTLKDHLNNFMSVVVIPRAVHCFPEL